MGYNFSALAIDKKTDDYLHLATQLRIKLEKVGEARFEEALNDRSYEHLYFMSTQRGTIGIVPINEFDIESASANCRVASLQLSETSMAFSLFVAQNGSMLRIMHEYNGEVQEESGSALPCELDNPEDFMDKLNCFFQEYTGREFWDIEPQEVMQKFRLVDYLDVENPEPAAPHPREAPPKTRDHKISIEQCAILRREISMGKSLLFYVFSGLFVLDAALFIFLVPLSPMSLLAVVALSMAVLFYAYRRLVTVYDKDLEDRKKLWVELSVKEVVEHVDEASAIDHYVAFEKNEYRIKGTHFNSKQQPDLLSSKKVLVAYAARSKKVLELYPAS